MNKELESFLLLTDKELEIMELFMIGMKKKQIAKRLNLSGYYISKNFKSIVSKLNARNCIHAAAIIAAQREEQNLSKEFFYLINNPKLKNNFSVTITLEFVS